MFRSQKGFTLIELMIVVVIIGILAAIAIPNFIAMQNRAKEGSIKANMHTLQLAAEDYGVRNDGVYSATMTVGTAATDFQLPAQLQEPVRRPHDLGPRVGRPGGLHGSRLRPPSGITSYGDSATATYNIKGYGKDAALTLLVLTAGQ